MIHASVSLGFLMLMSLSPQKLEPVGNHLLLQLLGNGYIELYEARLLFHIVSRLNSFFEFVRKRVGWSCLCLPKAPYIGWGTHLSLWHSGKETCLVYVMEPLWPFEDGQ